MTPAPGQAQERVVPVAEWLKTFVPLGTYTTDAWAPLGAGVLIVDLPVVWLVTSKSLVRSAEGQAIAAFMGQGEQPTILDLSEGHAKTGLGWIDHAELDLCASLFPMNPAWNMKAFTQQQSVPLAELSQLLPVASLGCPYGIPAERPEPFLFPGSIARITGSQIYSTAPLLAQNLGAPLILASGLGGVVKLAGIQTESVTNPAADPRVPPVSLSVAVGMEPVWELVRGESAIAQREAAVSNSG